MKVKIYTHNLKVDISDDLPKALQFFKDKGLDIEFTVPEETSISLIDAPVKLYKPLDGTEDVLMYIFDRFNDKRAFSYALNFSKTLQVSEISTSTFDDAVDYTWKTICHEIMHSFFHRLHRKGIDIYDCMDSTIVNGVMVPYYLNDQPYNPKSNFSVALKSLQPYWSLLFNKKQMYKYFSEKEVATWQLKPELWSLLDQMREIAGTSFVITSGLRTPQQNKKVGGSPNSAHLLGLAVDLDCNNDTKRTQMLKGILNCGTPVFLEIATKHLHIDISPAYHQMGWTIVSNDE